MPPQKPPANRRERCGDHMPCNEADVHQIAGGALAHQASHLPSTRCSSKSKPRGWQPAACTSKQESEPARPQPPARARSQECRHKNAQRLPGQLLPTRAKARAMKTYLVTLETDIGSLSARHPLGPRPSRASEYTTKLPQCRMASGSEPPSAPASPSSAVGAQHSQHQEVPCQ